MKKEKITEKEHVLSKLHFFLEYSERKESLNEDTEFMMESLKRDFTVIAGNSQDFSKFEFDNIIGSVCTDKFMDFPSYHVEKIALKGAIWGKLEVRKTCLHFSSENNGKRPEDLEEFRFGTKKEDFLEVKNRRKIWKLYDITKVYTRSFNLMDCALEIFTTESKSYFFNIFSPEKRDDILAKLRYFNPHIEIIKNKRKMFMMSGIQDKWIKGEISNFEYLIQLNTYAGLLIFNHIFILIYYFERAYLQ